MKILILFIIQFLLVVSQDEKMAIESSPDEIAWCMIGTIANVPPKPIACKDVNEIYACAFGEARCDGLGYCGTPPCHWRYQSQFTHFNFNNSFLYSDAGARMVTREMLKENVLKFAHLSRSKRIIITGCSIERSRTFFQFVKLKIYYSEIWIQFVLSSEEVWYLSSRFYAAYIFRYFITKNSELILWSHCIQVIRIFTGTLTISATCWNFLSAFLRYHGMFCLIGLFYFASFEEIKRCECMSLYSNINGAGTNALFTNSTLLWRFQFSKLKQVQISHLRKQKKFKNKI